MTSARKKQANMLGDGLGQLVVTTASNLGDEYLLN
jgi:hypothetical protein